MFSIGQVAEKTGLTVETIRYYEKEGLVKAVNRNHSGYRQYDDNTFDTFTFIGNARQSGFTLKEVKQLLELGADSSSAHVKAKAEEKLKEIENKIEALEQIKSRLSRLSAKCDGQSTVSECPIIDALHHSATNKP